MNKIKLFSTMTLCAITVLGADLKRKDRAAGSSIESRGDCCYKGIMKLNGNKKFKLRFFSGSEEARSFIEGAIEGKGNSFKCHQDLCKLVNGSVRKTSEGSFDTASTRLKKYEVKLKNYKGPQGKKKKRIERKYEFYKELVAFFKKKQEESQKVKRRRLESSISRPQGPTQVM